MIESQQQTNAIKLLPVELLHILNLESLPLHHRDPFDRMLIAQAVVEGLPILSRDPLFAQYAVQVLW
jgi:PIN domain nuclease of toxin-antitoxin system